jgi:hypothetical protein
LVAMCGVHSVQVGYLLPYLQVAGICLIKTFRI